MKNINYTLNNEDKKIKVKSDDMEFEIPYDKVAKLSYDLNQIIRAETALNPKSEKFMRK
ncbi:MAG: hypothetical protein GX889_01975 [Clostridiales bacterium]|nr:hypothetical protein [Clostridiales bacterium]